MITHLNKERQNDDIGSTETKELHEKEQNNKGEEGPDVISNTK